jgi:hypothetical protein
MYPYPKASFEPLWSLREFNGASSGSNILAFVFGYLDQIYMGSGEQTGEEVRDENGLMEAAV